MAAAPPSGTRRAGRDAWGKTQDAVEAATALEKTLNQVLRGRAPAQPPLCVFLHEEVKLVKKRSDPRTVPRGWPPGMAARGSGSSAARSLGAPGLWGTRAPLPSGFCLRLSLQPKRLSNHPAAQSQAMGQTETIKLFAAQGKKTQ